MGPSSCPPEILEAAPCETAFNRSYHGIDFWPDNRAVCLALPGARSDFSPNIDKPGGAGIGAPSLTCT